MNARKLCILLLFLLFGVMTASAQDVTGQIRGTVKDSTGALVPDATVNVINTDTGQTVRSLHSGQQGEYLAPLLMVGHYKLEIIATGFKKFVKSGIMVNASDRLVEDAALEVGGADETVTAVAESQRVNLDSATVEGLIEGNQVRQLPLNNRNYEQLVTLQPGVTSNAADQIYVGTTNPSGQVNIVSFSVNGSRQSQNNWTIDGADNVDHGSNITLLVYPSVDAISEFKVERSNYSPEFGRSAAGQINVVTRGGGMNFHGNVYEYFRNDVLNANIPINKLKTVWHPNTLTRPILRYNDFGGTFGGPFFIPGKYNTGRKRTFFFFSEEDRLVTTPVKVSSVGAPSPSLLQGKFLGQVCTSIDTAGNCLTYGTSIPVTSFNSIAAAYIKDIYSKIPNLPTNGSYNYTAANAGVFNYREELYRVDHVLTSKVSLMGRLIFDHIPTKEPFGLFGPQASLPGVANTTTNSPGHQYMVRVFAQFSERMFNETGYAYSYGAINSDPTGLLTPGSSPDIASSVVLPYHVTLNRVPSLSFDDGDTQGGFGQYRDSSSNNEIFDNFSWTMGHHALRFGMSYNHYQKKENAAGNNAGTYEFDSTNAAASNTMPFEQDWANFLLGFSSSAFTQANQDMTANVRQNLWEFYGQDTWRALTNLTVSYGIRYSYFPTPYGEGGNLVSFDQNLYNVANAPQLTASGVLIPGTGKGTNGTIIGGVSSPYGRYITQQDKTNVAPRIGLAWDPKNNGKISVRAGFGMFYDSVAAGLIEDNVFNNIYDSSLGSNMSKPDVSGASTIPPSLYGTNPNWKTPYSESYNFDIQSELGKGWITDIGYAGNSAKHLTGLIDINQVSPSVAAANGFIVPNGTPYAITTAASHKLNPYRPYKGYTQIGQISPIFKANYSGLQASLNKHFAQGSVGAFYTWSKNLTDNQTDRSTGTMYTYCIECEYGRAQLDRKSVFSANYIYDTPWYHDQKGFAGHILGAWEVSGILTVNSGLPITVLGTTAEGDPMASGYRGEGSGYGRIASIRPMQVANPNTGPKRFDKWFNTSAFSLATTSGVIPTERRGAVNGPGLWRYDMSLLKNIKMLDSLSGQFKIESFNVFNHNNPSSIGSTYSASSTATYGRVTNTRDGRTVQLAFKLVF